MPFAAYMIVFLGIPLYVVIHGSLTTESNQFTFSNFKMTWSYPAFRLAFENSLILSLWTSVVGAVFGTWLAVAVVTTKPGGFLHRVTQSGSGVLAYFAGVPLAFAFIAALGQVGVVTVLLKHLGINLYADGFTISSMVGVGLCYVYFQIPLMVILITPALQGLRSEWQDAALNLGFEEVRLERQGPVDQPQRLIQAPLALKFPGLGDQGLRRGGWWRGHRGIKYHPTGLCPSFCYSGQARPHRTDNKKTRQLSLPGFSLRLRPF